MKLPFIPLLKIILEGKSSMRFLVGVVVSFAFSISVILCTIGLMDGFESTLVKSLKRSSGDLIVKSREGFFLFDSSFQDQIKLPFIKSLSPLIQVEAFVIANGFSRGVLVKGVEEESFLQVTSLEIKLEDNGVVIGSELAKKLQLQVGDKITLTFASKSKRNQGSPILKSFTVTSIIEHGVYEKDLRFIYVKKEDLVTMFKYNPLISNMILIKTNAYNNFDELESFESSLQSKLSSLYYAETFWSEFKTLLDAVEVEKLSISLILQLIVVVAIFNIIAFIIFISERKSQEFFLLRVLGLNLKTLIRFWIRVLILIWAISSLVSVLFTYLFNYLLVHLPYFQLPGDIYVLSKLHIDLTFEDYFIVFGAALLWVLLIGLLSIFKMKRKTLLQGLRQEFS